RVAPDGDILTDIDRAGELIHAVAISAGPKGSAFEDEIVVLDEGPDAPRLFRYSEEGDLKMTIALPADWQGALHEVELLADGAIAVDDVRSPGARYIVNVGPDGHMSYSVAGSMHWGPDNGPDLAWSAGRMKPVDAANRVMEKTDLGVTSNGEHLYLVGEYQ